MTLEGILQRDLEKPNGMDSQFNLIAPHYDALMAGVPYRLWANYIQDLLKRFGCHPHAVLDVACGTGNVSEALADRGYEVVGVDVSAPMIEIARTKSGRVAYHVQDIAELDLGRTFDLAISLFDSLNYVTDTDCLARGMRRVGEHLNPGGLFIFDVNTIYALAHHFFDQANLGSEHYPRYIWNSHYDHATRICHIDMTFEVMENGRVRQFKETHIQRGHSLEELTQWLLEAGFGEVETFHAYRLRKPNRRSDRVFFVARKV